MCSPLLLERDDDLDTRRPSHSSLAFIYLSIYFFGNKFFVPIFDAWIIEKISSKKKKNERKSEGTMKKNQRISFIIEQRRGGERSLSMIFMAEDFGWFRWGRERYHVDSIWKKIDLLCVDVCILISATFFPSPPPYDKYSHVYLFLLHFSSFWNCIDIYLLHSSSIFPSFVHIFLIVTTIFSSQKFFDFKLKRRENILENY